MKFIFYANVKKYEMGRKKTFDNLKEDFNSVLSTDPVAVFMKLMSSEDLSILKAVDNLSKINII